MLESFLLTYGYIILFIGTFLEGETILLIAGFLAHEKILFLPLVIIVAAVGAFLGDQFFFMIGKIKGKKIIKKYKLIENQVSKINRLIEKYDISFMIGFRFVYGIRTITPLIMGTSNIPTSRFMVFNAIGAIFWAILIGCLGYLFGATLTIILGRIKHLEMQIIIGFIILGALITLFRFIKIKYESKKTLKND
ncbi:MAG: DedA family protein [Candidatus Pacearchaeota archaeon]|jgi:membrane protein DedA with SNARE-associated domain